MTAILIESIDCKLLKAVRREADLSQEQLATKAGMKTSVYQKIERGDTKNPGSITLGNICDILGLQVDQVLKRA